MGKIYKTSVNGSFEFDWGRKEIDSLDAVNISSEKFHILENGRSFKAEILHADLNEKKYTVSINSNSYEVSISDELDLLIEKMGLSLGNAVLVNEIHAPMPGLILDVNVKEGDEVKEGDPLLVLEAMKMENTLNAPRDGVVKSIVVKKGQTVDKNRLMIEMEP